MQLFCTSSTDFKLFYSISELQAGSAAPAHPQHEPTPLSSHANAVNHFWSIKGFLKAAAV